MILIFLAYPNMLQYFLYGFECIDVDGESRLKIDLEVKCWSQTHSLFLFMIALPSLVAWGAGLPMVTFWLLNKNRNHIANSDQEKEAAETYGFIFGGFKSEFYFWESTIILRKVLLIIVCIFLGNYGSLTQALITLLILILFLVLTARKRPFFNEALFDLEALSISTAILSVYCGLFFLADTNSSSSDLAFALASSSRSFLIAAIVIVNSIFFVYWLWRVFSELEGARGFILRTCPKLYLCLFACGDRDQAYLDRQKQVLMDDNDSHKDEFMKCKYHLIITFLLVLRNMK